MLRPARHKWQIHADSCRGCTCCLTSWCTPHRPLVLDNKLPIKNSAIMNIFQVQKSTVKVLRGSSPHYRWQCVERLCLLRTDSNSSWLAYEDAGTTTDPEPALSRATFNGPRFSERAFMRCIMSRLYRLYAVAGMHHKSAGAAECLEDEEHVERDIAVSQKQHTEQLGAWKFSKASARAQEMNT